MNKLAIPKTETILVVGLVYVLVFFGAQKLIIPNNWIGWIPNWLDGLFSISKLHWTYFFGVVELFLGVGLAVPKSRKIGAWILLLYFLSILSVTRFSDIGIRDAGLLFMTLALLRSMDEPL